MPRSAALAAASGGLALAVVALAASSAHARAETVTLRSRPFTLSSFTTVFPKVGVPTPRRTGYITRMNAHLVYENGRRVSIRQVMLHHIVFLNDGIAGGRRKRTTCKGRGGEPFWGSGEERQPLLLPRGYGYRVSAHDRWRMQTMLMSHHRGTRRVRVEYRIRMITGRRLRRVKPLWLRANGCATHPSYEVYGDPLAELTHRKEHLWRMPVSGRIVAASAHLHGSSKQLTIKQPRCGDRTLVDHRPLFGHPDDIVYRIRPLLHEPGPIATGHFLSKTGLPIRKGELLRVTGIYDASRPHPRVMAITHVYVATDPDTTKRCAKRPRDAHIRWTRRDGTQRAPSVTVPLSTIDRKGNVKVVERPPGPKRFETAPKAAVHLRRSLFVPANLSVPRGARISWIFDDTAKHNVTIASGPRNVASDNLGHGGRYEQTFNVAGEYRLFCYLHPVTMHQVVNVR